jgi:hypothetical protein
MMAARDRGPHLDDLRSLEASEETGLVVFELAQLVLEATSSA